MPTYVYKFVETGETIEVQQAFTDEALTEAAHPATGDLMAVKKVFTPVGVTFKGTGFYKTDSRSGRSKGSSTGSSGDGARDASTAKTESTSDKSGTPAASGTSSSDGSSSGGSSATSGSSATTPGG